MPFVCAKKKSFLNSVSRLYCNSDIIPVAASLVHMDLLHRELMVKIQVLAF